MNTYTNEQLLMCEKEDLVNYITELKKENANLTNDIEELQLAPDESYEENCGFKKIISDYLGDHLNGCEEDITPDDLVAAIECLDEEHDKEVDELKKDNGKMIGILDKEVDELKKDIEDEKKLKALHSQAVKEMDEWKMKCVEVGVENHQLKKQLEEVSKMNARVWKQLKRWPKKPNFNLSDDEEEMVEVKGTIIITSDTEPYEQIVVEFCETITKEQYEDEDWMENIDDHLKLTEPYSIAGCDIQIDFK